MGLYPFAADGCGENRNTDAVMAALRFGVGSFAN